MREYELTIPAGEERSRSVPPANFLRVKTAASELRYRFEDASGAEVGSLLLSEGNKAHLEREFVRVRVDNDTGASADTTVVIGAGDVDDTAISGNVSLTKSTDLWQINKICPPSAKTNLSGGTVRREVGICNFSSNTTYVVVGGSSVDAVSGVELRPGATIFIATTATIYAYNPSPTDSVTLGMLLVMD